MSEENFDVTKEVEPKDFNNHKDRYNNHIHVIPDPENGEIRAYLHIGEAGSGKTIKTTIENVTFKLNFTGDVEYLNELDEVKNWFLAGSEADNFLAFVNCLKWERTEARVRVEWYEEAGRPMMEESDFNEEMLSFGYKTESGQEQRIVTNNLYRPEEYQVQMLANFQ